MEQYFEQFVGDDDMEAWRRQQQFERDMQLCATASLYEHERRVRNREREFALNTGWTGEHYWETADWRDLEKYQLGIKE